MRYLTKNLSILLISLTYFMTVPVVSAEVINLAVANSTCKAIKKVGELFKKQHNVQLNFQCKSSGRLAKGLVGDSIHADIYISANRKWMDFMLDNNLIKAEHISSPWSNTLVVAVPKNSLIELTEWQQLESNAIKKIFIGDPSTAPFGRYTKQAMQSTGLWSSIRDKLETRKHITLLADSLADADDKTVGILFYSNITDKLRVIYSIDSTWHQPINYYIGVVGKAAEQSLVNELFAFIQGAEAQAVFIESGFKINTP